MKRGPADITNQQLLDYLKQELPKFATKEDLQKLEVRMGSMETRMDNMEVKMQHGFDRLQRHIRSSHSINVSHHLETRSMIGDLSHKVDGLREGLARAAGPA